MERTLPQTVWFIRDAEGRQCFVSGRKALYLYETLCPFDVRIGQFNVVRNLNENVPFKLIYVVPDRT